MQHDGWIDLSFAFVHDLVITEKMILLHLHSIQTSRSYHNSCLIYDAHNLSRYFLSLTSQASFQRAIHLFVYYFWVDSLATGF